MGGREAELEGQTVAVVRGEDGVDLAGEASHVCRQRGVDLLQT